MGIVHHSRYIPYFEEARVEYLRHLGHPYTLWREKGVDAAVLEVFVQYRQALRFDDEIDVHLQLAAVRHARHCPDGLPRHPRRRAGGDHGDRARRRDGRRPADTPLPAWLVEIGRVVTRWFTPTCTSATPTSSATATGPSPTSTRWTGLVDAGTR